MQTVKTFFKRILDMDQDIASRITQGGSERKRLLMESSFDRTPARTLTLIPTLNQSPTLIQPPPSTHPQAKPNLQPQPKPRPQHQP